MKIDTLITIGVVIYIIISIRKALSHGKKPQDPGKAPVSGWKQKIQDMANQIKEEIEKANREMQAAQAPPLPDEEDEDFFWDEIEDDEDEKPVPVTSKTIRQSVLYEPEPRTAPPELPVSALTADDEEEDHRNHRRREPAKEAHVPGMPCRKGRSPYRVGSKRDLKRAVVWSEILRKPLALRD